MDEADLVKTDGSYIYQVKLDTSEVLIIQALPASQMKIAARIGFDQNNFTLVKYMWPTITWW